MTSFHLFATRQWLVACLALLCDTTFLVLAIYIPPSAHKTAITVGFQRTTKHCSVIGLNMQHGISDIFNHHNKWIELPQFSTYLRCHVFSPSSNIIKIAPALDILRHLLLKSSTPTILGQRITSFSVLAVYIPPSDQKTAITVGFQRTAKHCSAIGLNMQHGISDIFNHPMPSYVPLKHT